VFCPPQLKSNRSRSCRNDDPDRVRTGAIENGDAFDDGGDHRIPQNNPSPQPLLDVVIVDASQGWAVGVGATIVHTADGGLTWNK